MTVKRDDLLAAATKGVLHFGEIDPLLIFLAQREAIAKKVVTVHEKTTHWKTSHLMYYLGGILAIGVALLFAMFLVPRAIGALGMVALLWFTLLYALCAIGAAAWFDIRGGNVLIGMSTVLIIALMPLAVFALQRVIVA